LPPQPATLVTTVIPTTDIQILQKARRIARPPAHRLRRSIRRYWRLIQLTTKYSEYAGKSHYLVAKATFESVAESDFDGSDEVRCVVFIEVPSRLLEQVADGLGFGIAIECFKP
jgi:hypothetical protein